MAKEKIYKYPNPQKIQISNSDLKLKFREFFDAIKRRFSLYDLLVIGPAWIPLFTSEFKDVLGLLNSGFAIRGFYAALLLIGTFAWLLRVVSSILVIVIKILRLTKLTNPSFAEDYLKTNETNPNKKVDCIESECN